MTVVSNGGWVIPNGELVDSWHAQKSSDTLYFK